MLAYNVCLCLVKTNKRNNHFWVIGLLFPIFCSKDGFNEQGVVIAFLVLLFHVALSAFMSATFLTFYSFLTHLLYHSNFAIPIFHQLKFYCINFAALILLPNVTTHILLS